MDSLTTRRKRGEESVGNAAEHAFSEIHPEDRFSYARGAISDILTAVLGPAGSYSLKPSPKLVYNDEAIRGAKNLLNAALLSYQGDAEDYESGIPGERVEP